MNKNIEMIVYRKNKSTNNLKMWIINVYQFTNYCETVCYKLDTISVTCNCIFRQNVT